ncbi:MAG: hydrogenase expression/formation protein HypE [Planctomycetota bacterium]|jgi:hydrogenase expression/formation protein HypE
MKDDRILLAHGGGGELSARLVREIILAGLGETAVGSLDDAAIVDPAGARRLAFTTDSYVVKPLFFPGGDLGRLAICGTVNDLAMRGARPLAISLSFIIEEGLKIEVLSRIVASTGAAAREACVRVATGDTKVVERGAADGLFVNTAGVGAVVDNAEVSLSGVRPGDEIVLSGPVGNHAIAVLAQREGLSFETEVESDVAPLWGQVEALIGELGGDLHALNDPTRGGLAASLNNLAASSAVAIEVDETTVPVDAPVAFAAEMLGFDVFSLANEGKFVAAVSPGTGDRAISVLSSGGSRPAVIGVSNGGSGVSVRAAGGGKRILEMPYGEDAPRIC